MPPRKTTPPLAGPTCPGCQRLAADLTRLQHQQRNAAAQMLKLQTLFRTQTDKLTKAYEQNGYLREALEKLVERGESDRLLLVATGIDNDDLLAENKRQRRELLELRQIIKTRTVAVPQMPSGTTTLYPN